jgi:hypothetical protein
VQNRIAPFDAVKTSGHEMRNPFMRNTALLHQECSSDEKLLRERAAQKAEHSTATFTFYWWCRFRDIPLFPPLS